MESYEKPIEVMRFKRPGKYYDTITVPVPLMTADWDVHILLQKLKDERGDDAFVWMMTGVGLKHEVPRLLPF